MMTKNTCGSDEKKTYMSVDDAIQIKNMMNRNVDEAKHQLILLCEKSIKYAAEKSKEDTIWTVPTYLPDHICYNVTFMSILLIAHFVEKGFYVKLVGANSLYISWRYSKAKKRRNNVRVISEGPVKVTRRRQRRYKDI